MKKAIIILLSGMWCQLSAQEPSEHPQISIEDAYKIRNHLALNYIIPYDSQFESLDTISYQLYFTVNEEGRIVDPKVINTGNECEPCERELLRVIKTVPRVIPAIVDDKKVKSIYILPFLIRLK